MAALGGIRITKAATKITITLTNNTGDLSTALLYIQRVGVNVDFAVYGPSKITSTAIVFNFDSVLLDQPFGRYAARLNIAGVDKTTIYLQYDDIEDIEVT